MRISRAGLKVQAGEKKQFEYEYEYEGNEGSMIKAFHVITLVAFNEL